ncbi:MULTISPECIES: carbon-nitrogen hydrolase family protein [Rhodomicrobium]|uniref:carbon-nitrogen hydrolase family protein n=1 Tax=Rhodomicrobium TaxID=1068 RepID=UPI000B4B2830|nr:MULTISPECIES: carbon-nitrogen hydrolase family protein [Rhodomicrobium]
MRIALLQMSAVPGDVAANLARIAEAAANAARRGAELLIAPELATIGYGAGDGLRDLAEPRDGAQVAGLAAIAAASGLAIIAGFPEQDGAAVYNSALFTDGHAAPVVYRKSHLYGDYERSYFAPGDPVATLAEWRGLKLGMLICYDVEFPENVRRLAVAGADFVAVPTALPVSPEAAFIAKRMIPVRAFENQIFVAYANHTGRDDHFAYAGISHVVAPDGGTLAMASVTEARVIIADIRPGDYLRSRDANAYLRDLRLS